MSPDLDTWGFISSYNKKSKVNLVGPMRLLQTVDEILRWQRLSQPPLRWCSSPARNLGLDKMTLQVLSKLIKFTNAL